MIPPRPSLHPSTRIVQEVPVGDFPAVVHPEWAERFEWLVQGTTVSAGANGAPASDDGVRIPFDLGLFSDASPPRAVVARWERLRSSMGMSEVVHAHQVHSATVRWHRRSVPGLHVVESCDGHATTDSGVLLAVTVADCVPVSVVDPVRRAVALVHAGWRGAAAGIVGRGVAVLAERAASHPENLRVHLGPAICGRCYEVGPEVFTALGLEAPLEPEPVNLRRVLASQAVAFGVAEEHITVSAHCTLCGSGFFSHRGGDRARQVGFLGVRRA